MGNLSDFDPRDPGLRPTSLNPVLRAALERQLDKTGRFEDAAFQSFIAYGD